MTTVFDILAGAPRELTYTVFCQKLAQCANAGHDQLQRVEREGRQGEALHEMVLSWEKQHLVMTGATLPGAIRAASGLRGKFSDPELNDLIRHVSDVWARSPDDGHNDGLPLAVS